MGRLCVCDHRAPAWRRGQGRAGLAGRRGVALRPPSPHPARPPAEASTKRHQALASRAFEEESFELALLVFNKRGERRRGTRKAQVRGGAGRSGRQGGYSRLAGHARHVGGKHSPEDPSSCRGALVDDRPASAHLLLPAPSPTVVYAHPGPHDWH